MHRGDIRSQRRPDQAKADTRVVSPGIRPAAGGGVRGGRHVAQSAVRQPVSREDAGGGQAILGRYRVRRRRVAGLRRGSLLRGRRHQRLRFLRQAGGQIEASGQRTGHRRQRALLSFHAAEPVRPRGAGHWRGGDEQGLGMAAAGGGKAVREEPRDGAGIERRPARSFPGIRRLSDRPLPG